MRFTIVLTAVLAVGCAAPATGHRSQGYGGFPSFLPSDTVQAGSAHQVVDASATDPVLATQGDTVRVHLTTGTALVTATGPDVPVTGQAHRAPTSPATWHLVVTTVAGAVTVLPDQFQAVDSQGGIHALRALQKPQTTVPAGSATRFDLFSDAFPTGQGRLRWIPNGHLAPVEWDFVVETD